MPRYRFQTHPKLDTEDLPSLPAVLQEAFERIYKPVLIEDPYGCGNLPHHELKGNLTGYRTLDIAWNGIAYRLVYHVYESPAPRRLRVFSFDEHDSAYDKAKARAVRKR